MKYEIIKMVKYLPPMKYNSFKIFEYKKEIKDEKKIKDEKNKNKDKYCSIWIRKNF